MIKSRAFLVSMLMLLAWIGASGQSRFKIGFKTGINFSSLTGIEPEMNESFASISAQPFVGSLYTYQYDADFFSDAAIRFSATANISYKLTDKAQVELSVGYAGRGLNLKDRGQVYASQQGQNSETNLYGNFSYERKVNLNYLSVPVNFKYYVGVKNRLFVTAGFYTDFLLSSKVSGEQSYLTQIDVVSDDGTVQTMLTSGESSFDDNDAHTSKFDLGVTYGGGVEFPLNTRVNFVFALTMNHGLYGIDGKYDNDTRVIPTTSGYVIFHDNYYGLNSNAKNFTLSASIGITYQL